MMPSRSIRTNVHRCAAACLVATALLPACGRSEDERKAPVAPAPASVVAPDTGPPAVDLSGMEPQVAAALQAARAIVEQSPVSAEAWWRFAAVHDAHNLLGPAIEAYRRALLLDPDAFATVYNLAIALDAHESDSAEVLELLERARTLRPDYPAAALRVGEALLARGRAGSARAAFETALDLDPDLLRAQRSLGQALVALGADDAAATRLEHVAAAAPDDGPTQAALAQVYGRLGRAADAAAATERAREATDTLRFADPARAEVLDLGVSSLICRRRARQRFEAGRFAAAIDDLQVVVSVDPADVDAHYQLGYAAVRAGRLDLARAQLDEVLRLDPSHARAMVELGGVAIGERRFDEAATHFREALQLAPDAPRIRWLLGSALAQSGQPEAALLEFEMASMEAPDDARGYLNWGMTLLQQGDRADAARKIEEAVRLDPDYVLARCNLGAILERLGRTDEAIDHYRAAAKLDPNSVGAARLRALGIPIGEDP